MASKTKESKRYYGMTKLRKGCKIQYESRENKHGWSLGLVLKDRPVVWLRNIRFASKEEVERAVGGMNVKFVPKVEA